MTAKAILAASGFALLVGAGLVGFAGKGVALSDRKEAQPVSGEASAGRATLTWQFADATLRYKITTQGSNACYAAGDVTAQEQLSAEGTVVVLQAEVTYAGGMCAQVVQEIVFEGEVPVAAPVFAVRADVLDQRSGRMVVIQ